MIIVIEATGVQLDLPADIKLNIEMTSPIFSNAGSMSLPISLPLSSHNRRALNFPDRLDIYDSEEETIRTISDINVIVKQGSWQQPASLSISGCSESSAEATLYFKESNIWSKIADMTLPQVMAGLHYGDIPPTDSEIETYRNELFNTLRNDIKTYPTFVDPREDDLRQGHMSYSEWSRCFQNVPNGSRHESFSWLLSIRKTGGLIKQIEWAIWKALQVSYILPPFYGWII